MSLTFDDGDATQYAARTTLASHGMHGTFFLNGPRIGGDSYYMTWSQINDLYADGNEIGGHTAYHVNLTTTDPTEAQRQVCYDRDLLLSHGFAVTDFAYPYGAYNSSVEQIVAGCGYNSARTTNAFGLSCAPGCSESIPPRDPYATRVAGFGTDTLQQLETEVTNAESNGGGWIQFVFHQICDGCNSNAISPSTLSAFLDWLQPRAANGTNVKTVAQVIGGSDQPAVQGPPLPPAPNGSNAIRNPGLEQDADADGVPDCFVPDSWGSQTANWSRTTDAHTGSYAETVTVGNYSSGDDKLLSTEDLGYCTPTVTPGHQYVATTWYKSSAPVHFVAFTRDGDWQFPYWTSGPVLPASSTWTKASWVTPVIPSGVNGLTFGLAIDANGTLTVDDVGFDDASPTGAIPDTTPPTSMISCNGTSCLSSYYNAPVSVSLVATDNSGGSGVSKIVYTTDGSDPGLANGTVYGGPFSVASTSTVRYRSYDNAGNAETIKSQTILVDTTAPAVAITSPTSGATVTKKVNISATASDSGGSGIANVSFYVDGKLLGTATASPYTMAWNTAGTRRGQHTLTAIARDKAGNTTTSAPVVVSVN